MEIGGWDGHCRECMGVRLNSSVRQQLLHTHREATEAVCVVNQFKEKHPAVKTVNKCKRLMAFEM